LPETAVAEVAAVDMVVDETIRYQFGRRAAFFMLTGDGKRDV
jgi:hypothetical protein